MKEELEAKVLNVHFQKVEEGKCDNFASMRPLIEPDPKLGMRMYARFNHSDDADDTETLVWVQGRMQLVSDGSNIAMKDGAWRKKGDVLVLWDSNESRNEQASIRINSLPKALFNKQVEGSYKIDISL